jgi:hypothetical protein
MIIINTIIALFLYHHQLLEYACWMVIVAFQIIFYAEMYANDFFFFLNYFWYQHIKKIQNIQTILNFNKK